MSGEVAAVNEASPGYVPEAKNLSVPTGYQQTEAGVIPEDWYTPTLGELSTLMTNGFVGTATSHYVQDGSGVLYIQGYNVEANSFNLHGIKYVSESFHQAHLKSCLRSGDLLTVQTGDVGLTTVIPDSLAGSNCHALIITRLNQKSAHPDFVSYYLNSSSGRARLKLIEIGTTMKHLNVGDMLQFSVPLPPSLEEQRAIATALSDVDALLEELDRLIAKKRDLKQATMQQLLTCQTRLPGFEGEWEAWPVADLEKHNLVKLSRGKVISKKHISGMPGEYPIYSSSIHNDGLFGCYGDFMFDEELITWSVDGGGNFFYRQKHKFSVTNVCGYMRVDTSRINYQFIAAQLQHLHRTKSFDYQSKAHPSVIRKEYEVKIPTISEQEAIANIILEIDDEIRTLEHRHAKTVSLKQAMMQELLTGRIRLI